MTLSKIENGRTDEGYPYYSSLEFDFLYDWTRKHGSNPLYVSGPNARHCRAAIRKFFKNNWPDGSRGLTLHKEKENWRLHIKTFETVEVMDAIWPSSDECDVVQGYKWEMYHQKHGHLTCEPWPFVHKESKTVKLSEYIAAKIAEQLRTLRAKPNLMNVCSIAKKMKFRPLWEMSDGSETWTPSREFLSLHLAKVKDCMRNEPTEAPESTGEGWQAFQDLLFEQTDKSAEARLMCYYYAPVVKKLSYRKLIARYNLETNRTTLYDVIDSQFVKLSPTSKGNVGELHVLRQLESLGVRCSWGGGGKSVPDISGEGWAVAVKCSFREPYEIHTEPMTPENRAKRSWCVFIRPRVHRIRIFPISGAKMVLSGGEGSSCGIGEIGARLKEMIEK